MPQISSFRKIIFFIVLALYSNQFHAQVNSKSGCDSLIEAGIAALNKNQNEYSLKLLFQAAALAEQNNWANQEFLAKNNIGTNYYRLSEYCEAMNYLLEAYNIADKKLTPGDALKPLNNIAAIYLEEKKYKQAEEYFKKVYFGAKKDKNNISAGIAAENLGTHAVETHNLECARSYYMEAAILLQKKPEYVLLAKGGLANCELLLGHTKLARESAKSLLSQVKNPEFYNLEMELLAIISKSYLSENNPEMALSYVNEIFARKPNLSIKMQLFELLTKINTKRNRLDLALQYKDSLFNATAKFNEIKNAKLLENSKIKFDLQNYKNQSQLAEAKSASERKILYCVLFFSAIIILFVLWTLRNLSLKLRQKKLIASRNEQILALELEKEKQDSLLIEKQFNEAKAVSLLEQEKLKSEVELKNRKLSAKALYLSGRNEMIEEILSELAALPQASKDESLITHIKSLKNQLKSDKEWDNFITHFEEVNQGLLNTLKLNYPNLTVNDIRYISYIYMNLSVKEIASMLNITQETCRKRKERILAKMKLSTNTNLYTYLTSL